MSRYLVFILFLSIGFSQVTLAQRQGKNSRLRVAVGHYFSQKSDDVYVNPNDFIIPFPSVQLFYGKRIFLGENLFLEGGLVVNYLTRWRTNKEPENISTNGVNIIGTRDYNIFYAYLYAGIANGFGVQFKNVSISSTLVGQYRLFYHSRLAIERFYDSGLEESEVLVNFNDDFENESLRKTDYGLQFDLSYQLKSRNELSLLYYFGIPSVFNRSNYYKEEYALFNRRNQQFLMLGYGFTF